MNILLLVWWGPEGKEEVGTEWDTAGAPYTGCNPHKVEAAETLEGTREVL